jgi:hypothetical protein
MTEEVPLYADFTIGMAMEVFPSGKSPNRNYITYIKIISNWPNYGRLIQCPQKILH